MIALASITNIEGNAMFTPIRDFVADYSANGLVLWLFADAECTWGWSINAESRQAWTLEQNR